MKAWLTPSELVGLPGLPGTERGLRKASDREGWHWRKRQGRGGGREYHVSSLPQAARVEIARRAAQAQIKVNEAVPVTGSGAAYEALPATSQQRADAKLEILRAFEAFKAAGGLAYLSARFAFAAAYNAGGIEVEPWVRAAVRSTSGGTLQRWRSAARKSGAAALGGRYGNRKGSGLIDTDDAIHELVVGLMTTVPHTSAKHVMAALRARLGDSRPLPSFRTVQRFMRQWRTENAVALTAVANPDAHRSRYLPAFGTADAEVVRLNQVWEMDSTPADVMLLGEEGRPERHAVIGVVDVLSRRGKLLVARTSRASAIASLLRRAILDWGVPEVAKTDQGQDYVSRHMRRALIDLGIEQHLCPPFTPEGKPHIERFFGTVTRDLFELLPGYIGHDIAGRKSIESRKSFGARLGEDDGTAFRVDLTPDELQARCDTWCDSVYARAPHSGIGGRSPFEAAAAWRGAVRRVADERALDLLLAEAPGGDGYRVVGKKGIRLDSTHFIAGALGAWSGETVHVRYDPEDLGRIHVFDPEDGAFICTAEAPERTGIDRRAVAIEAKNQQRAVAKGARAEARRLAARIKPHTVVDDILAKAAEAAGRVVALPRPGEAHETPGLDAAAEAAHAGRRARGEAAPKPAARTPAQVAQLGAIAEDLRQPVPILEDRKTRFRRALALERQIDGGAAVTEDEERWLRGYQTTPEYQGQRMVHDDFPDWGADAGVG